MFVQLYPINYFDIVHQILNGGDFTACWGIIVLVVVYFVHIDYGSSVQTTPPFCDSLFDITQGVVNILTLSVFSELGIHFIHVGLSHYVQCRRFDFSLEFVDGFQCDLGWTFIIDFIWLSFLTVTHLHRINRLSLVTDTWMYVIRLNRGGCVWPWEPFGSRFLLFNLNDNISHA